VCQESLSQHDPSVTPGLDAPNRSFGTMSLRFYPAFSRFDSPPYNQGRSRPWRRRRRTSKEGGSRNDAPIQRHRVRFAPPTSLSFTLWWAFTSRGLLWNSAEVAAFQSSVKVCLDANARLLEVVYCVPFNFNYPVGGCALSVVRGRLDIWSDVVHCSTMVRSTVGGSLS